MNLVRPTTTNTFVICFLLVANQVFPLASGAGDLMYYLEHLSDRQAADAVRGRIDRPGQNSADDDACPLELCTWPGVGRPGISFQCPSEFRLRLIVGNAEALLLDTMLARF